MGFGSGLGALIVWVVGLGRKIGPERVAYLG
jgi:hypothetical protein